MTENTQSIPGYLFRISVSEPHNRRVNVELAVVRGENLQPVYNQNVHLINVVNRDIGDYVFDQFLERGLFENCRDLPDGLYESLSMSREDRFSKIPPDERRFRFIHSRDSEGSKGYLFTSDITDILEHREYLERLEASRRVAEEARADLQGARENNAPLIERLVSRYFESGSVDSTEITGLRALGLVDKTTIFRESSYGEDALLRYEFVRDGVKHMGFLGFDENSSLIVDDRRFPEQKLVVNGEVQTN